MTKTKTDKNEESKIFDLDKLKAGPTLEELGSEIMKDLNLKLIQNALLQFQNQNIELLQAIKNHHEKLKSEYAIPLENIRKSFIQAASITPQIKEMMEEIESRTKHLTDAHSKDKVFLSPFFHDFSTHTIYTSFVDSGKTAIEVYHEFFQKIENIDKILQTWAVDEFFKDRIPILKAALHAHQESKYELSIPVLIRELEGILQHLLVANHKNMKNKLTSLNLETNADNLSLRSLFSEKYVAEIICDEIFNSNQEVGYLPSDTFPNRHSIQHGTDITYFKQPHYSTRLILLIDSLRSKDFRAAIESINEK